LSDEPTCLPLSPVPNQSPPVTRLILSRKNSRLNPAGSSDEVHSTGVESGMMRIIARLAKQSGRRGKIPLTLIGKFRNSGSQGHPKPISSLLGNIPQSKH
jgi:hypothetical protein